MPSISVKGFTIIGLICVLLGLQGSLYGQQKKLRLEIRCEQDQRILIGVSLYAPKTQSGHSSDKFGIIEWRVPENLALDDSLRISYVGFEQQVWPLADLLEKERIYLKEIGFQSEDLVVKADKKQDRTQIAQSADIERINAAAEKNLAGVLQGMSGVSQTGMGDAMAKPVIHGLFGDRIAIVKNGNPVQAHLWSREHSPPISGLQSRSNIQVLKGAATVKLSEQAMGGTILIEPRLPGDDRFKNRVFTDLQSNGTGIGTGFEYGKEGNTRWKIGWYSSARGQLSTPNYRIQNSANQTHEGQFVLKSSLNEDWSYDFSTGVNHQRIGIPRVAHIGSLTDLAESIERGRPLASANASYAIDEPRQQTTHADAQITLRYAPSEDFSLAVLHGLQFNQRQEFDIRRGGRSNIPVTDLQLIDVQLKPTITLNKDKIGLFELGLDWNWQKNNNVSGTGIRPFIPNYTAGRIAFFGSWSRNQDLVKKEIGLRVGYRYLDAAYFNENAILERRNRTFIPFSAIFGLSFEEWDFLHIKFNSGLGFRAPNVAELFANGLHHGASNYELGDPNLAAERSWKNVLQLDFHFNSKLLVTSSVHLNTVQDFVYLAYSGRNAVTIRGAYPVFNYQQDRAWLFGLDTDISYILSPSLQYQLSASYLKAERPSVGPLPDIEPFNVELSQRWRPKQDWFGFSTEVNVTLEHTDRQRRFIDQELFAAPPSSFTLLHAGLSIQPHNNRNSWRINLRAQNITNTSYRRYLDRLRFFVHQPGFNLLLNFEYPF